jgi:hypothetical protein
MRPSIPAVAVDSGALLSDFGFYEACQVSQRLLPAEITGLQRNDVRRGKTALAKEITLTTWRRFFDPYEPVHALVAERGADLVGLAHYLFHVTP